VGRERDHRRRPVERCDLSNLGQQNSRPNAAHGSSDVVQFFIKGKTMIGPDAGNDTVEFFRYPAGGKAYATMTGLTQPTPVVISK
jgi:hypothetical protein